MLVTGRAVSFVRLMLTVVVQNDITFVDLILIYSSSHTLFQNVLPFHPLNIDHIN